MNRLPWGYFSYFHHETSGVMGPYKKTGFWAHFVHGSNFWRSVLRDIFWSTLWILGLNNSDEKIRQAKKSVLGEHVHKNLHLEAPENVLGFGLFEKICYVVLL